MEVKIKLLIKGAMIPTRGSKEAAGYDLYANNTEIITIEPHKTVKIGTGVSMEIPKRYFGGIFARSGLATKSGLRPANCTGVIDSDYRGEIIIALHNDTDIPRVIDIHERIAQLIILPYQHVDFVLAEELNDTERGDGGFGSTGIK